MNKKMLFLACVLILLVVLLSGCGGSNKAGDTKAGQSNEKMKISISSGPAGGTFEIVGAAMAESLNKNIPGVSATSIPGAGATGVTAVENGDATLGLIHSRMAYDASQGKDPYKKQHTKVRALMSVFPNAFQLWTLDGSGINSVKDLVNKRYCPSSPGQTGWVVADDILKASGINLDQTKISKLSWSEAVSAMQDKGIEALSWVTSYPQPAINEITTTRSIKLIPLDDNIMDTYEKMNPGALRITIPAGTYKGQKADVKTIGTPVILVCNADLSDDMAYKIVKQLFENRKQLGDAHALLKDIDINNVAKNVQIELHPGAKKYYEEIKAPLK